MAFAVPALIWKRIAAFFIDILVLDLFVLFPFRSLFKNIVPKNYSFSELSKIIEGSDTGYITLVASTMSVLVMLYFILM